MAANEKEVRPRTAIAQRNNELQLAKAKLKAEADKVAADANAAGQIQTNLRAKEIKEAEADAEIAKQKKMVDLAAMRFSRENWMQRFGKLRMPNCINAKRSRSKKYEAERAAEAQKFASSRGRRYCLRVRQKLRLSVRRVLLKPKL